MLSKIDRFAERLISFNLLQEFSLFCNFLSMSTWQLALISDKRTWNFGFRNFPTLISVIWATPTDWDVKYGHISKFPQPQEDQTLQWSKRSFRRTEQAARILAWVRERMFCFSRLYEKAKPKEMSYISFRRTIENHSTAKGANKEH